MFYDTSTYTKGPERSGLTSAAFNNALAKAQASADSRLHVKEFDRPGVSRSAGTRSQADIKAAQALSDGVADAYQIPMQSAVDEADDDLQFQRQREQLGLGTSGLGMQSGYANALAALDRNQQMMQFQGNVLGGLLGGGRGNWLDNFLGY